MKISRCLVVIATLASVGCTTVSKGEYQTGQAILKESSSARRQLVQDCSGRMTGQPAAHLRELAAVMRVDPRNAARTFCSRMVAAIASGRITYDDMMAGMSPHADQSKLIRVLAGR